MNRNKFRIVGAGLCSLVLAGLAVNLSETDVSAETKKNTKEHVSLDYRLQNSETNAPIATYSVAPSPRGVMSTPIFSGVTFRFYDVVTFKTLNNISRETGVSVATLRSFNGTSAGKFVLESDNISVIEGARVLYSTGKTDPKYYYKLTQGTPTKITTANWKKQASIYINSSGSWYESRKFLGYSLHEHLMSINSTTNKLKLSGWSAQVNYTDTTGNNNLTAIIAEEQGTATNKIVQVNTATKSPVRINPSSLYVFNAAIPSNAGLRCPTTDAYLDRPINFTIREPGWSAKGLQGCWHNFANTDFTATVDLAGLFSGGNMGKTYDLYIANSTGSGITNRIIYKPLSARTNIENNFTYTEKDGFERFSGKVKFTGKDTPLAKVGVFNLKEDRIYMRATTASNPKLNTVNGSNTFKVGSYNLKNTAIVSGTLYYYLEGFGATAGYKGWAPQTIIDDSYNKSQLNFEPSWTQFRIHFVDNSNKTVKLNNSRTERLSNSRKTITVNKDTYKAITDSNGYVWKMVNIPENKTVTQTYDTKKAPSDITFTYSKDFKATVRYVNINTGQEIRSQTVPIASNKANSFSYGSLGVVDGTNRQFVTYLGKKYKFANTGVSTYRSEMDVLGIPQKYKDDIAKYKNNATQTRTVTTANAQTGVDDIIFYFYEPQPYTVNHMRVDSNNNFVRANGTKVSNPSEGVLYQEHGLYYTGDTINVFAYGIGVAGKPYQSSFGKYYFSGRGRFQNTGVYLNGTNMASGKSTFKMPLARIATKPQGDVAYLYYRREIASPTGSVIIGTDPTNPTVPADKSNPGNGNGTGVAVNPNAYLPSITGQYNWYLTKENNVNSANWNKSKLAMTNVASIGNSNVFAVKNVKNRIQVNAKNAYVSSYTGETSDLYYGTVAQTRKVNPTVGEGIVHTSATKVQMKLPTVNNSATASNVSSIYGSRNYTNLVEKVAMNSKIYKSGASNYNDALGQVAGKGTTLTYQTTYDYTNRVRDVYTRGDVFAGHVFSWNYSYSTPDFDNAGSGKYNYKATSNVDHKVGEESTTPLKKAGDKLVSKVGILRNYTNQGANNATDTVNNGSANTVTLNETITKVETINPTLKTQSKVKAEENLTYKNDITTTNRLSTRGQTKETFVGYKDSFNGFTYNATNTGYNKYLVQDVDFNFRNVNGSLTSPNMGKVSATGTTTLESGYNYQMGVKVDNLSKLPLGTTTQTVKLNLDNQYGVLSDSGLLIERARGLSLDSSNGTYYKTVTQNAFGKAYEISSSDKLVKQTGTYVGYYYLPVDGNSTLKPNTVYTNRNVLSSVGLNDRNIAIDNTFQFSNYLVGSSLDNTAYASFKTNLSKDGDYTDNKIVITSKEKEAIKSSNSVVSKDNVNFRTMNAKEITNTLKKFLGFQN